MKKHISDNRGFSLVELIVVVAIMAILLGTMAVSITQISRFRAKECRNKMAATLNAIQTTSLSKSTGGTTVSEAITHGTYATFFYWDNDKSIYMISTVQGEVKDVQKVGRSNVILQFDYSSGSTATLSDVSGNPTVGGISYHRSLSKNTTPADIEKIRDAAKMQGVNIAFDRETGAFLQDTNGLLTGIHAIKGDYQYDIVVHPKTGKVVK